MNEREKEISLRRSRGQKLRWERKYKKRNHQRGGQFGNKNAKKPHTKLMICKEKVKGCYKCQFNDRCNFNKSGNQELRYLHYE